MNGIIDIHSSCFPGTVPFVYDPKYSHFLFMRDSSILGCKFMSPEYTIYRLESQISTPKYDFDSEDSLMFYIDTQGISKLNPYDNNAKPISVLNITGGSIILALDTLNKQVYWANHFDFGIKRATYDGSRMIGFAGISNGAVVGFAFSGLLFDLSR
ncbi:uncharacterized protein [Argopecten irradians]|uniref:uncharacterized protein n=1 Tax=Argopecten irradians TaxID=31199 RepID=UPI003718917E